MSTIKVTNIQNPSSGTDDIQIDANGNVAVDTNTLYVDATNNRVGVGTASPGALLNLEGNTNASLGALIYNSNSLVNTEAALELRHNRGNVQSSTILSAVANAGGTADLKISVSGSERARIDSSGRLLVGTSTSPSSGEGQYARMVCQGTTNNNSGAGYLSLQRGDVASGIASGANLGLINFGDAAGNSYAWIRADTDAAGGTSDYPGRLIFSTTADGASSPTERMRIESDGNVHVGKTGADNTVAGISILNTTGTVPALIAVNTEASDTSAPFIVNRQGSDGRLVQFRQANTTEGTIAVSGTTVTYGGGHLARWSQLPNNEDPSSILKGTVMSNLDEMCEWGNENNEQLNKTKISDVEGDPNVAGVFVATSFDEEGPMDFFVAMTGDMVIRIAAGTTVKRGDLLMSAGDGTAKPQDDDIIRSKTIAKVTSTNVSCTYDDGSYCVPCVLMAC